uniref:Thaumatin-like protein 1 n=1 Tax=Anthurium amnicola TaxID=1678845 RepID=A0A1D1YMN9_9ARAE
MANKLAHGVLCFLSLQALLLTGVRSATFTFSNSCEYAVWPGLLSGAGTAPLATTGFALEKGESRSVSVPSGWSGRFWGRTLCSADASGKFTCGTGDCGSGKIECSGSGAVPPATLAEFTLDGHDDKDFYDVSLVDGYNLPMLVVPQGASVGGNSSTSCVATGCLVDLNGVCPPELRVAVAGAGVEGVACRSACEAFGKPEYCCSGAYANPNTCHPSSYSQLFKNACPRAYSYAYDDGTSTFTCAGGTSYHITFCPTMASLKSTEDNTQAVSIPHALQIAGGGGGGDAVMIYEGGLVESRGATPRPAPLLAAAAMVVPLLRLLL